MARVKMTIKKGTGHRDHSPRPQVWDDGRDAWLARNRWTDRSERVCRDSLSALPARPLLSVIMPAYNTPPDMMDAAISSLAAQVYQEWELCVADDGSPVRDGADVIAAWAARDARVRPIFRESNGGISAASNDALAAVRGKYVVLMDHDDVLTPDALAEVALAFHEHPDADLVYSDEDRLDGSGHLTELTFKPPFCPVLLLTKAYVNHISAARAETLRRVGGFRSQFDGAQDHDLYLRVGRDIRKAVRIPKVLYHWRMTPGSASSNPARCLERGAAAVADHLKEIGCPAQVAVHPKTYMFHLRFPDVGPRASVVIPTKDQPNLIRRCLDSVSKATYESLEVVVVDTGTTNQEALDVIDAARRAGAVVVRDDGPSFNFSRACNIGAAAASGDILIFLNNDVEAKSADWASTLVGYACLPGVGAVGAKLVTPSGAIQHAGVGLNMDGWMPAHLYAGKHAATEGYCRYAGVPRTVSAVTAACMAVPKVAFRMVGGFCEDMPCDYNDADLCLRLGDLGLRSVYCPWAVLAHDEGATRGKSSSTEGHWEYRMRHAIREETWANPNLLLTGGEFAIRPARAMARLPSRQLRVLAVTHSLGLSGAPAVQHDLLCRLAAAGKVQARVHCHEDGPLAASYRAAGISVSTSTLQAALAGANFDVAYVNTSVCHHQVGELAGRLPRLWHIHEMNPEYHGVSWRRVADAASTTEALAFPSAKVRDFYRTLIPPSNDGVVLTSYSRLPLRGRPESRESLGVPADAFVVLNVAHCEKRKRQADLIAACVALPRAAREGLWCVMVGDEGEGDYLEEVRWWIRNSSETGVRFVRPGRVADPSHWLAAADVYACPSESECLPLTVAEAMAASLPVVCTNVGGMGELVAPGHNAIMVTPGGIAEMADAIGTLKGDRSRLAAMSRASREVYEFGCGIDRPASQLLAMLWSAYLSG